MLLPALLLNERVSFKQVILFSPRYYCLVLFSPAEKNNAKGQFVSFESAATVKYDVLFFSEKLDIE